MSFDFLGQIPSDDLNAFQDDLEDQWENYSRNAQQLAIHFLGGRAVPSGNWAEHSSGLYLRATAGADVYLKSVRDLVHTAAAKSDLTVTLSYYVYQATASPVLCSLIEVNSSDGTGSTVFGSSASTSTQGAWSTLNVSPAVTVASLRQLHLRIVAGGADDRFGGALLQFRTT